MSPDEKMAAAVDAVFADVVMECELPDHVESELHSKLGGKAEYILTISCDVCEVDVTVASCGFYFAYLKLMFDWDSEIECGHCGAMAPMKERMFFEPLK